MKEGITNKIQNILFEMFDNNIPWFVLKRIDEEMNYFEEKGITDFLYSLSNYLDELLKKLGQKNICHSRQEVGYSLILYLLGINDLNPLPQYEYNCDVYGRLYDGWNLDFELFKIKYEALNETISLSYCNKSFDYELDGHICHFVNNKLTKLTYSNNYEIDEVLFDKNTTPYFAFKTDIDIDDISSLLDNHTCQLLNKYATYFDFEELVSVIALSYGTNVIEANERIGNVDLKYMIVSLDDLYHLLVKKLDKQMASSICGIANSDKTISTNMEKVMLQNGLSQEIVTFVNECRFLYTRAGAISIARSIVKLAYVKMRDEDANKAIHI